VDGPRHPPRRFQPVCGTHDPNQPQRALGVSSRSYNAHSSPGAPSVRWAPAAPDSCRLRPSPHIRCVPRCFAPSPVPLWTLPAPALDLAERLQVTTPLLRPPSAAAAAATVAPSAVRRPPFTATTGAAAVAAAACRTSRSAAAAAAAACRCRRLPHLTVRRRRRRCRRLPPPSQPLPHRTSRPSDDVIDSAVVVFWRASFMRCFGGRRRGHARQRERWTKRTLDKENAGQRERWTRPVEVAASTALDTADADTDDDRGNDTTSAVGAGLAAGGPKHGDR